MIWAVAVLVVLVSPSMQYGMYDDWTPKSGDIVKRQTPTAPVLKPTELYFCSLKAKRAYGRRAACERQFELQQGSHHCSSRRMLMMRIDNQLAYLQRMVLLAILQKAMQAADHCNRQAAQGSGGVDKLLSDVASLQEQHINLTRYQSKLPCVYPRLMQMKDNLAETIARKRETVNQLRNDTKILTEKVQSNDEKLNSLSENGKQLKPKANETTKLLKMAKLSPDLTRCNNYLNDLVSNVLSCSSHTLPSLLEKSRAKNDSVEGKAAQHQALQNKIQACNSGLLQCQASDVCDKLQTAISKDNQTRVELQQVTDELKSCTSQLTALKKRIPRCEATVDRAYQVRQDLLVNVTMHRHHQQGKDKLLMQCEIQLSSCHENITVCQDMSAELEDGVHGCWSDLDKWKFRTDLCEGQKSMLLQKINATEDYIGDMREKLSADMVNLKVCRDRQLYHKSGYALALKKLSDLAPDLNSTIEALDACYVRCPQLKKAPVVSRCPLVHYGRSWHEGSTGCFYVTRPGAGHAQMQTFCTAQAPGSAIVRLSNVAMAKDAYEALLQAYRGAERTELLRRHRRAWVDFEGTFEYAGYPAKSPQCQYVTCECWTMRFPWKGRSQLYECEESNLPAICYVQKNGA